MRGLRDGLIIAAITLGLLLLAELGLRLREQSADPGPPLLFHYDNDCLYLPNPGASGIYVREEVNGGDSIPWHINSRGYCGRELSGDGLSDDRKSRILVLGDSNIQARFTREERSYCRQLDNLLDTVEVINGGVIGFGPDQSLARMRRELPVLQPGLVIFHVFADNDYGDLVRNMLVEVDEQGRLVDSGLRRMPRELNRPGDLKRAEYQPRLAIVRLAAKVSRKIRGEAGPGEWIETYLRWNREEYEAYVTKDTAFIGSGDDYDIDLATLEDSAASALKLALMRAVLAEAADAASHAATAFMVLVQPSVIDLCPENYHLAYPDLEARFEAYSRRRLSTEIELICREEGIPCLNLFDAFQEAGAPALYFLSPNNHWNDAGQALAARLTADYLQSAAGVRLSW